MFKTIGGLMPFAVALAVIGGAIVLLLGRNAELGKLLFAAFFVGHAFVHVMFLLPRPADTSATAGGTEWPFDMARSWLVTGPGLDLGMVRLVGVILVVGVAIGFLLSGLATVGLLIPSGWWQGLIVTSSAGSVLLLALFFSPQLVLGVAIDAVLLWVVLAAIWTPVATAVPGGSAGV
jgi:hypothetical protein